MHSPVKIYGYKRCISSKSLRLLRRLATDHKGTSFPKLNYTYRYQRLQVKLSVYLKEELFEPISFSESILWLSRTTIRYDQHLKRVMAALDTMH